MGNDTIERDPEVSEDGYGKHVTYLKEHPEKVFAHWCNSVGVFRFAGKCGDDGGGCLTMIRLGAKTSASYIAATPELTAEIRADERIPFDIHDAKDSDFTVFAEWQRRIDRETGRTPFVFEGGER